MLDLDACIGPCTNTSWICVEHIVLGTDAGFAYGGLADEENGVHRSVHGRLLPPAEGLDRYWLRATACESVGIYVLDSMVDTGRSTRHINKHSALLALLRCRSRAASGFTQEATEKRGRQRPPTEDMVDTLREPQSSRAQYFFSNHLID